MSVIETITFPDAVAVCCLYGQAALIAGGDLTTVVNSRVTNDERQVTLELTDSDIHDLVVQTSTVRAEVRTGDGPLAKEEAQDLGQLMRGLFGAMQGTTQAGATVYKVNDVQGLSDSPDDRNGNARFVFHFSIAMRGGATLTPSTSVSVPDWLRQGVLTVEAGSNVTVDDSDPQHPVVSSGAGGGSGLPDPWTANQTSGEVVATVDDPTKTPLEIVGLVDQSEALLILTSDTPVGTTDIFLIRQSVGAGGADILSLDDSGEIDLHVIDPGANGFRIDEAGGPGDGAGDLFTLVGSMLNRNEIAKFETTNLAGSAATQTLFDGGLRFSLGGFGEVLAFDPVAGSTTLTGQPGQVGPLLLFRSADLTTPIPIITDVGRVMPDGLVISNAQTLPNVADLAVGDHGSISDPAAANPTITLFVKDDAGNLRTATVPMT